MKRFPLLPCCIFISTAAVTFDQTASQNRELYEAVKKGQNDTAQLSRLVVLAIYQIQTPGEFKTDLDSAADLFSRQRRFDKAKFMKKFPHMRFLKLLEGTTGFHKPSVYLALLLSLICLQATAQSSRDLDLKNSLPDLEAQLSKSKTNKEKVDVSLKIGSFYLTNKADTKANLDSSRKYAAMSEVLSGQIHYEKGQAGTQLLKARMALKGDHVDQVRKMIREASGTTFCNIHFMLGGYYLTQEGNLKSNLDIADAHFTIAQQYADKNHFTDISLINRVSRYHVMLALRADPKLCDRYFSSLIAMCKTYHNKRLEEKAELIKIAYGFPPDLWKKFADVARAAGDTAQFAGYLKNVADDYLQKGKLDSAENKLQKVLKIYTEIGYKNLQYTYDLMSAVAMAKGNTPVAIQYGLAAVKYAEASGTDINLDEIYERLADNYQTIGLTKQANFWYQKTEEVTLSFEGRPTSALINDLIKNGKAKQAMVILDNALIKFPKSNENTFFCFLSKGECFAALGQMKDAEKSYLQARAMIRKDWFQNQIFLVNNVIAAFYIRQQAFEKAAPFLDTLLKLPQEKIPMPDLVNLYSSEFKVDSARRHYLEAIKYFEASKKLSDSLSDRDRQKQSEQLALQYNTAERDHENLVLRNHNTVQQSELEKESFDRRIVTIGLAGAVFIICVMIYLYYAKQKNNKLIIQKNLSMQKLLAEKEVLLADKEILIKEVHHRVKNNLHLVSSLLESQSAYLENEALHAVKKSQHRVQAISILHQKLYSGDDITTVSMPVYLREVISYLKDSFIVENNVVFDLHFEDIKLDVSQAVPIGLIMNEAVTNAIKYAFPNCIDAVIKISLRLDSPVECKLKISDNGVGLDKGFDIKKCRSLGMSLIQGLAKTLGAKFTLQSIYGTDIMVTFNIHRTNYTT
ncbi:MAG TPA: histidine kinase dimerization/phosphoacceptor domain -containing protein [Mucilaginibacter sp.]